ncbi:MAG: hypothetical protein ACOYMA_21180 [Bacteroidia bacterium]
MKNKITQLLLIVLVLISSCGKSRFNKEKKTMVSNDTNSLIIGDPFDIGVDNILIFPTGSNYKPNVFENQKSDGIISSFTSKISLSFKSNGATLNDRFANTEYINSNENEFDIRNIIFYNLKNKQSYPLIKDTLHILSFALHKEFSNPLIFYRVVKYDNNNDSIFNSADPVVLYISDLNGNHLTQITPENEKFIDYFYYPQTNNILVKTIIDSNNDKVFSIADETNFREINLKNPAEAKDIFSKSLKDSLRMY